MEPKKIHEENEQKTFALAFETGEEVMATLMEFAGENGIDAARFTAIGAFS